MNSSRHAGQMEPSSGINLADIYFVIFRHKWKIIVLSLLGFAAATGYYFTKQPPYQSEAKLLIRFVTDSRNISPADNNARVTSLTDLGDSVMNSEMQILSTLDLANQVATNVGPERILAQVGGGNDASKAAGVVRSGLKIEPIHGSSVIDVIFRHQDPTIVQPVLKEIINQYLENHAMIHATVGFSDDSLTEETAALRAQISQTEDELRIAKTNAGIISVVDEEKAFSDENARIREELFKAEADLAERQAAYAIMLNHPGVIPVISTNSATVVVTAVTNVPDADMEKYKSACLRLKFLDDQVENYLSKQGYTEDNKLVKETRVQIAEIDNVKTNLESKYSSLVSIDSTASVGTTSNSEASVPDPSVLAALSSRIKTLRGQLVQVQSDAAALDAAQAKIDDLQRKKQIQEGNYTVFANNLEQAHIDEQLGPGKVSAH